MSEVGIVEKLRFLIVEDEILIGLHLKLVLSRAGYDVIGSVSSAEEAIANARQDKPDVILMDISLMSEMDGIECARQICAFSSALIIFATGFEDPEIRKRAMALHPAAYLIKPVELQDIEKAIQAAFAGREQ